MIAVTRLIIVALLCCLRIAEVQAQGTTSLDQDINTDSIAEVVVKILQYLHGAFGALILVIAGVSAIISAAFGQYRAALGLLVVAVGVFVLESLILTFFPNDILDAGINGMSR